MTDCRRAAESLLAYRAGALDGDDHEQIRSHLASCLRCQALDHQMAELPAVLNESIEPPPGLWSEVMKIHAASKDGAKPVTPAVIPDPSVPVKVRQDCVFCRGPLFAARVHCADCLARYHESCFLENKGCGVLGCEGREFLKPQGFEETSSRRTPGLHARLGRSRTPLLALAALSTAVGASFLVAEKLKAPEPAVSVAAPMRRRAPVVRRSRIKRPKPVVAPAPVVEPAKKVVEPAKPVKAVVPAPAPVKSSGMVVRGKTLLKRSGEALSDSSLRFAFPKSEPARPDLVFDACGTLHINTDDTFPWRIADLGHAATDRSMSVVVARAAERLGEGGLTWRYRVIEPRVGHAYALQYRGNTRIFLVIDQRDDRLFLSWKEGFFPAEDFGFPEGEESWRSIGLEKCEGDH